METFEALFATWGLWIVAAAVFADQAGLPIPSPPALVLAGGLVGAGELDPVLTLAAATLASLPADLAWFEAGRRRGHGVLRLLCRISLEPDSCVRSTTDRFARHGLATLLFAKFVPGLQTIAPPLAGATGVPRLRFLLFDAAGALLFCGSFLAIGALFADEITRLLEAIGAIGGRVAAALVAALAGWIAWKAWTRHRFLRALAVARVAPHEVVALLDRDPPPVLLDLRHPDERAHHGGRLPGSTGFPPEELEQALATLPRDRDIVLYCT